MRCFSLVLMLFFSVQCLWACSCVGGRSVKKEVREADLVVVGTVIDSATIEIWNDTSDARLAYEIVFRENESIEPYEKWLRSYTYLRVEYTIRVEKRIKGGRKQELVSIRTGFGGGDCGFRFKKGQKYLIYAVSESRQKETWWKRWFGSKKEQAAIYSTNICWKTKLHSMASEDLKKMPKRLFNKRR